MLPLEGTADQVVRLHATNVGRLRTAMAATLDPNCLTRFGECLVRIQQQYVRWMSEWAAERDLEGVHNRPMRDEWTPDEFAAALEAERTGQSLEGAMQQRLAEEFLRLRSLDLANMVA